jgi:cyclic-di-GMP-binding protein
MKIDDPVVTASTAKQTATLRQGIETELGKKIQRLIKDSKLKVQAAIQDKQVRVSGKSRDELQAAIALMRGSKFDMPVQFTNFRD